MNEFFGVIRYEFSMSVKRKSLLVIAFIFTAFYTFLWLNLGSEGELPINIDNQFLLSEAGQTIFFLNLFLPVVIGILSADRAVRDKKLGVREILRSTGINNAIYVLGKYFGVVFSMLSVELLIALVISVFAVILNSWPVIFIAYSLLAVIVLSAPGLFFIIAFSLACPLIMPVRVYQILFTGYWFWGNYLSPQVMLTVSDTLLNASGKYALQAFFGAKIGTDSSMVTQMEAISNIGILLFCAGLALFVMITYIRQSEKKI